MRIAFVALIMTACSFGDPAVDGHFKCDDLHACPNGEPCVNGACTGGAGSGTDGGGSGSGSGSGRVADGVKCGASNTCAVGMQCCAGPIMTPVCQPAGTTCSANGASAASCDGVEDCPGTEVCCGNTTAACGSASCGSRACQSADDCIGLSGNCCFELGYLSWGFCC